MYDRYTNYWWLDNLIWVLGYSHELHEGWYFGDDVVDVIGGDAYSEGIHEELYHFLEHQTTKHMPICHHENGPIPDPAEMIAKKVDSCWFLTWHSIHIHEQNTPEYIHYIYNHPYVITLESLPSYYKAWHFHVQHTVAVLCKTKGLPLCRLLFRKKGICVQSFFIFV